MNVKIDRGISADNDKIKCVHVRVILTIIKPTLATNIQIAIANIPAGLFVSTIDIDDISISEDFSAESLIRMIKNSQFFIVNSHVYDTNPEIIVDGFVIRYKVSFDSFGKFKDTYIDLIENK